MGPAFAGFAALCAVAVAGLLAADRRGSRRGVWVAKPLASLAFVAAALAAGALDSAYGLGVLAALVLSLGGDVALIPRGSRASFLSGVLLFLLGHVAFGVAFAIRGLDAAVLVPAALLAAGPVYPVLRWLGPRVPPELRAAVPAYTIVISAMLALAVAASAHSGDLRIGVGALLFYLSDLSVARDRFVAAAFANRAWGLPCYYAGQVVLASSAALPPS